jgi:hypothetical protein
MGAAQVNIRKQFFKWFSTTFYGDDKPFIEQGFEKVLPVKKMF